MRKALFLLLLTIVSFSSHAQIIDLDDGIKDPVIKDPGIKDPNPPSSNDPCETELRTELGSTINSWNWQAEDYTIYLDVGGSQPLIRTEPSPWFPNGGDQPVNMELLASGNPINFDFRPEDGWEVVFQNFGTPTEPIKIPFYVLTNRRTGITRGFFLIGGSESTYNTLQIGVRHLDLPATDGGTGLFNYNEEDNIFPVESFVISTENGFTAYNRAPPSDHWALVQFPAYYDPCTCRTGSIVQFFAEFSDINLVELNTTGTSTSEAVYESSSSSPIKTLGKGFGNIQKGFKLYKDIEDLPKIFPKSGLLFSSKALKWLPGAGGVITVLDQFLGGGKSSSPTLLGYNTTFDLSTDGTITNNRDPNGVFVNTPGGNHDNLNPTRNPIYDNPLGVFALLETPKINKAGEYETNCNQEECEELGLERFQLDRESIKYVVNQAAEYNLQAGSIQAGLIFSTKQFDSNNPDVLYEGGTIPSTGNRGVYTSPLIDLECLPEYTATFDFQETYTSEGETYGEGQAVRRVDIIFILTDESITTEELEPITVGRYSLEIVNVGDDISDLPVNPFRGLTPEEIDNDCNQSFINPVSVEKLTEFCGSKYSSNFATKSGKSLDSKLSAAYWGTKINDQSFPTAPVTIGPAPDQLAIFPNPANEQFTISLRSSGNSLVQIASINGSILEQFEVNLLDGGLFKKRIPTSHLLPGTYTLKVISLDEKKSVLVERFIIQR